MTEFVFGPYRLEVDVEATRAYYAAHNEPWIICTCAGCAASAPPKISGSSAALSARGEKERISAPKFSAPAC